jgi:hypothetical protein
MKRRTKKQVAAEEANVVADYDGGEYVAVRAKRAAVARLTIAARATLKDHRLNIRLAGPVLDGLKTRAAEEGLPYQTLISSVLHKFVSGRLVEKSRKV